MLLWSFIVASALCLSLGKDVDVVPSVVTPPTNYQKWAHLHWVWVKNSDGNQVNVTNLVNGYKDNHIPVGAVNIDSTWATQFNNFEVDKTRFPDFGALVGQLHAQDIRVILWATSMVNVENPDYEMAVANKYLVRNSHGVVRPLEWWHGSGGLLDYSNPEAVAWWHSKMDQVLDVHVDGFKCDGTDPYILEYTLTGGALGYNDTLISYRDYANYYYRDFFYYTRSRNAAEVQGRRVDDAGLIMSRPVDCLLDEPAKGCTPFSPKDVMYSGWVGDDDGSFVGLRACMRKVIYSAWTGYGNMGCDVGGYRDNQDMGSRYFLRSAQLNAFLPLMENGGGGEHRPWMYGEPTVSIYRKFVNQHHRLAAYLLTNGANAVDHKVSAVLPLDEQRIGDGTLDHIVYPQPRTYSYRLGADLLVHPVMYDLHNASEAKSDVGVVDMQFPADGATWLDWWQPTDLSKAFRGGDHKVALVPLESYSVFVRAGAFLPLHDLGADGVDMNALTFTWFQPLLAAAHTADAPLVYALRESISTGTGMEARVYFDGDARNSIFAQISSHAGPTAVELVGIEEPSAVDIQSWPSARCKHFYLQREQTLRISCADMTGGMKAVVSGFAH